jgi:CDGSH-type Zn-finger protein
LFLSTFSNLPIMATKLTVLSNGSLRVEGEDIQLVDAQGNAYGLGGRERISICRCGLSAQKPFCDGSHKGRFDHDATAFDLPAPKPVV